MQLALGAPNTLSYAVSTLLVLLLALLPGLPLALGLGRRSGWDLPTVLTASFALQVGVFGGLALAAHYLALSLAAVSWAGLAVLLLGGLVSLRPLAATRPPADLGAPALAIGALCLGIGVFERTWFSRMADAFYHLAAVRSLVATGRPMVTDPLFGTPQRTLDATAGVWHTVLAVWSRATGLDVATWLWPGATAVGAALTLAAFWVLARSVSDSRWAPTLAALAWLALGLSADLRWSAYPNRLSLGLAFVTLAALVRLVLRPSWSEALVAALAGFATVGTHLAAGEMVAAAGAVLLALLLAATVARGLRSREWGWAPSAALLGVGAAVAALSAPLVVPKAAIVRASWLVDFHAGRLAEGLRRLPGGWLVDTPGHLMKVGPPLFLLGAAIAVAAGVRAFRRDDTRALAVAALGGLPLALLLDPPVTTALLRWSYYLTQRVAILLPFTVFLALAWALASLERAADRRARLAAAGLGLTALVAAGAYYAATSASSWAAGGRDSILTSRRSDVRLTWGRDTLARLESEFGSRYPRVASDTETSYYLAGVMPVSVCAVTSQHTPFGFEASDGQARRDDMYALMRPGTAEDTRREILRRRGADYVLVPKYRGGYARTLSEMRAEPGLLRPVFETPTLALFRIVR